MPLPMMVEVSTYYEKQEYILAIADYNQAIARKRDYAHAYCYRGLACLHLEKWVDARESFAIASYIGMDVIAAFRHHHNSVDRF